MHDHRSTFLIEVLQIRIAEDIGGREQNEVESHCDFEHEGLTFDASKNFRISFGTTILRNDGRETRFPGRTPDCVRSQNPERV